MAFGDPSIPLTVSGMLTDCENDKSAWEALYVDNFFNLNEVLDFKSVRIPKPEYIMLASARIQVITYFFLIVMTNRY